MAPHRIANMNEDTEKFAYDSMKRTKKTTISLRTFKIKCLTFNVSVFHQNLLCRLRSSCLRHDVKSRMACVFLNSFMCFGMRQANFFKI